MRRNRLHSNTTVVRWMVTLTLLAGTTMILMAAGGLFELKADTGASLMLVAVAKWLCLATATVYAVACARSMRTVSWSLLAGGVTGFFVAQCVFLRYQLLGEPAPFPSAADPAFLVGILLFTSGSALVLRELSTSGFPLRLRERLPRDLALVFGLGSVLSLAMLRPLLPPPKWDLAAVLSLLYPVFDLLLMVPAVLLLQVTRGFGDGKIRRVWLSLAGAFLLFLVGDLLFAVFLDSESKALAAAVDASYLWGYGCLALASLRQFDLSH